MPAETNKQWVIRSFDNTFDCLETHEAPLPPVGENEVLVKIQAVSLNFRDASIPMNMYPFPSKSDLIPCSDGAGVVVQTGPKVKHFRSGDQVASLFLADHLFGDLNADAQKTGLGGFLDGCLQQYRVFNELSLVHAPRNLTPIEASTLPCAALTAWNGLYGLKPLRPGQTVLVQGTGGVSIFALQFAKAAGATVIATTSSPAKAQRLKELGADHVINYREDPNWGETARKLTRHGVDHVIEVGGPNTVQQSLKCVKMEGVISVIGYVGGITNGDERPPQILDTLTAAAIVRGIQIGSKEQMLEMVQAIEASDIKPVVDQRVFEFDQAREAYQYLWDQKHFGKVVIKVE
ncbi:zinc-dependent alcohol dehydrogenase family protein [Aspergillus homomorphus CBS 101889]|uniref:Zinc-binding oxidoreductase n=1 Tax=Aspergillus homomorphus (strain CBS 101889) TaxID=1450537 RepID=A0A395HMM9_ASPHC|nr:zinc-binding oxidoreductase [Aspergillus homomorphus CBS 101889]RAL08749.1 zinc-binding oxidoreductase [Aspergillus homomorphus CBS 101889]